MATKHCKKKRNILEYRKQMFKDFFNISHFALGTVIDACLDTSCVINHMSHLQVLSSHLRPERKEERQKSGSLETWGEEVRKSLETWGGGSQQVPGDIWEGKQLSVFGILSTRWCWKCSSCGGVATLASVMALEV